MVKNTAEAEDILQQSFMDAFTHINSYNGTATPGAWLKRIVINNCINHLKRNKLQLVEMQDNHSKVAEPEVEDVHLNVELIHRAINALPDGYRVVLSLYLLEGYDHSEIGEILGVSESTSKSQYHRAKKKLKTILTDHKMNIYDE